MRNKKIIALFIACLLLFVAVTSNAGAKKVNKKKVIYVDSDYYNPKKPSDGSRAFPYTKIQQGVYAASPGYTVFVFNGIYNENVVVNKTINLVGENKSVTIINSNGDYGISITADWVNMSGFNINGGGCAIELYYSNYSTISGNIVPIGYSSGIEMSYSSNNTISGNDVHGGDTGIRVISSNYNTITGNNVSGHDPINIILSSSNYNVIYNNIFIRAYSDTWNAVDDGNNVWNISKTPGTNIVGGPYLGGNYWSDYTGIDADGDGLGDTPYNIPGGSKQDMYPLMIT